MMNTKFDYYYGTEAEQFSFYRIPKILFTDSKFKNISAEAKLLYGLMLDECPYQLKMAGWIIRIEYIFTLQSKT